MSEESYTSAPNLSVEAGNGITYAYRRVGRARAGAPPLICLQHFRGNLDNWDPLLIDELAANREVIAVDNTGVGLSSGTVPRDVTTMARDAIAFLDALALHEVDLLGYSLGGMVAQDLALLRPRQVRRLVLAGTGPQGGGELMHGWIPDVAAIANAETYEPEAVIRLFFAISETSIARGHAYLQRFVSRTAESDRPNGLEVRDAQYDAIVAWGIPDASKLNRLAGITQPTLVANGDNDTMIPTVNSYILARTLPNARLKIFPDAGHGFVFDWPVEFADTITHFLA
ncbi:MAG: alpha/beta hydrolase fold protein [Conexibacter sp.]|nr:alpha/beta hydrolase fold protein [Conexibacter sp.]